MTSVHDVTYDLLRRQGVATVFGFHHCTKRTPRDYPWYDNHGRSPCNNPFE